MSMLTGRLACAAALSVLALPALAQKDLPMMIMPTQAALGGQQLVQVLRRAEVQTHLHFTLKQQQDLEDLLKNGGVSKVSITRDSHEPADPEALKREIDQQMNKQRMAVEERLKSVLKPDQYSRLKELALQWRGAVLLGDGKLADELKISTDHKRQVAQIATDYNREKMEIIMKSAQVDESNEGGNVRRMVRVDASALNQPGSESFKKLTALKGEAEQKILAALSPEERNAWRAAQGEPFTFRADIPGNRF